VEPEGEAIARGIDGGDGRLPDKLDAAEATARLAPSPMFLTIGNASYSIYLSHLFFLRVAELIGQRLSLFGLSKALDATYIVIALTLSIAGGICIHFFIERPISLLRNRHRSIIRTEPT